MLCLGPRGRRTVAMRGLRRRVLAAQSQRRLVPRGLTQQGRCWSGQQVGLVGADGWGCCPAGTAFVEVGAPGLGAGCPQRRVVKWMWAGPVVLLWRPGGLGPELCGSSA